MTDDDNYDDEGGGDDDRNKAEPVPGAVLHVSVAEMSQQS